MTGITGKNACPAASISARHIGPNVIFAFSGDGICLDSRCGGRGSWQGCSRSFDLGPFSWLPSLG